jgi:hypothetical protein
MDCYIKRGVLFMQPHEHCIVKKGQRKEDLKDRERMDGLRKT